MDSGDLRAFQEKFEQWAIRSSARPYRPQSGHYGRIFRAPAGGLDHLRESQTRVRPRVLEVRAPGPARSWRASEFCSAVVKMAAIPAD
jgi:hypothetical protein